MAKTKEGPKRDYRQEQTDALIAAIDAGTAPWQKPFLPGTEVRRPFNFVSSKPYRGGNALLLSLTAAMEFDGDPRWMTFKQAAERGMKVKPGSKGTVVEYWQFEKKVEVVGEDGEKREEIVPLETPFVRRSVVFNGKQIEGMPELVMPRNDEVKRVELAEKILSTSGAVIKFDTPGRAYYAPALDEIHSAPKDTYRSTDDYYATLLHELGHWTGHSDRLDREAYRAALDGRIPEDIYAKEELRAEIASYFLSMDIGIGMSDEHIQNHAAYVGGWLKALKEDKNEFYRAAKDAEKISTFLTKGLELERDVVLAADESVSLDGVKNLENSVVNEMRVPISSEGGVAMPEKLEHRGYERKTIDVVPSGGFLNRGFDRSKSKVVTGWIKGEVRTYIDEKKNIYRADFTVSLKAPGKDGNFPENCPVLLVSHCSREPIDLSQYKSGAVPVMLAGQEFLMSQRDSSGRAKGEQRRILLARSIHESVPAKGYYTAGKVISNVSAAVRNEFERASKELLSGYVYENGKNTFNKPIEFENHETKEKEIFGYAHRFSVNYQVYKDGKAVLGEDGKPMWDWMQVESVTKEPIDPSVMLSSEGQKRKLSMQGALRVYDYKSKEKGYIRDAVSMELTRLSVYKGLEKSIDAGKMIDGETVERTAPARTKVKEKSLGIGL